MILMATMKTDNAETRPKEKRKRKKGQKVVEDQCKCGSTTHLRTSHNECLYSKRRLCDAPTPPHKDDDTSPPLSDDNLSFAGDNSSDEGECTSADDWCYEGECTSADDWCYEDDIISSDMCVCGALGRAHKRNCPMSSRSSLPMEVYSTDSRLSQSDSAWEAVANPKPNLSKSGKRKSQEVDKHPVTKKATNHNFLF